MLGKGLKLKTTTQLVFFLWLVKSLKSLKIIGLLITWRDVAFFLISNIVLGLLDQLQIFWQLHLTELSGLLIDLGATWDVALDISKAFDRVWHAGLLHKLKSYGISGPIFGLILSFLRNRHLRVTLDGKLPQEYPINAWVHQGYNFGIHIS